MALAGAASGDLDTAAAGDLARFTAIRAVLDPLATDAHRVPRRVGAVAHRRRREPRGAADRGRRRRRRRWPTCSSAAPGWPSQDRDGGRPSLRAPRSTGAPSRGVAERADLWATRLDDVDVALLAYDTLPIATPDDERMAALAAIEAAIAPAIGDPAATPALQRIAVGAQRDAFETHLDGLSSIVTGTAAGLAALHTAVLGQQPFTDVDSAPFEVETTEDAMVALVEDVVARVRSLTAELDRRGSGGRRRVRRARRGHRRPRAARRRATRRAGAAR